MVKISVTGSVPFFNGNEKKLCMSDATAPAPGSSTFAPSASDVDIATSTPLSYAPNNFIRIDPINPWSEVRYDLIIPITLLYVIVSSCILCPPNFRAMYMRFQEFKRSLE